MSLREAAQYAGVSQDSLRRAIEAGDLKHGRLGRSVRVRRSEVDRLLEEGAAEEAAHDPRAVALEILGEVGG